METAQDLQNKPVAKEQTLREYLNELCSAKRSAQVKEEVAQVEEAPVYSVRALCSANRLFN